MQTLVAAAGEPDIKNKLLAGLQRRRQELQGAPRRLRPARRARRQGPRQAPRVLLLDRRRQSRRPSLRPIEGGVHGTAGARPRGLDAAVGPAARAQAVQPALRSVRARRARGGRLRQMVRRARCSCWFRRRRSWRSTCRRFQEFPPRQKPGSFSVDQAMEKLMNQNGKQLAARPEWRSHMKPSPSSSGIDRRVLLSTIGGASGFVRNAPSQPPRTAQTATPGGLLPSWNDGPAKQAIFDFVRATIDRASPSYRAARGTHRGFRSGRHALGRASHVHAGGLLPRTRSGGGGAEAGTQECRAVQDRAVGQSRGDRQADHAGSREDPRCDADRHDDGGVQRRGEEVARDRQASALEAALHRAHLPADARGDALSARQRLTRPTS